MQWSFRPEPARPVFVIGSYRSGTSILTWCLGQHPDILPVEETSWLYGLAVRIPVFFRLGAPSPHSHIGSLGLSERAFGSDVGHAIHNLMLAWRADYIRMSALEHSETMWHERTAILRQEVDPLALYLRPRVPRFRALFGNHEPKTRIVDGTPENSHYVYALSRMFPEARFIHILRNPTRVVESLLRFEGLQIRSEQVAYETWMRLVTSCALAERGLGSGRVLRIEYETLVAEPEKTLRRCCSFLDERFSPLCLVPMETRLNSSNVVHDADASLATNLASDKPFVRRAFALYQTLLGPEPERVTSLAALREMRRAYLSQVHAVDSEGTTRQDERVQELQEEVERLSAWGKSRDAEIAARDERIVALQSEVEKLAAWGKSRDAEIAARDRRIMTLEKDAGERSAAAQSGDAETLASRV